MPEKIQIKPRRTITLEGEYYRTGDEDALQEAASSEELQGFIDRGHVRRLEGLPSGFPGKDALEAAGYQTEAQVREASEDLESLDGIGTKTADAIRERLGE